MAFSVASHVIYLQNFSPSWPIISLSSPSFMASCLFVIVDHFIWFFHFSGVTHEARQRRNYRGPTPNIPGFTEIVSFFGICIWLAPLFLFLSLSANDNALPVSAGNNPSHLLYSTTILTPITLIPADPSGLSSMQPAQTRVSLFRSLFSMPKFRRESRKEGLLAPHSPSFQRSSLPPPSPTTSRYSAPPRSPGPRYQELDGNLTPANFTLNKAPRRPTPGMRQASGLGLDASSLDVGRTSLNKSD